MPFDRSAAAEARANNNFDPMPAGVYNVTIFKAEPTKVGGSGANADKDMYNVQFRVSDGPFTNRRHFERIPLFDRWAPTAKSPNGHPTVLFQFFEDALGYQLNDESDVPTPVELGGKPLRIRLRIKHDDYRDENVNEATGYLPPDGGASTPATGGVANLAHLSAAEVSAVASGQAPDPRQAPEPAADSPWAIR